MTVPFTPRFCDLVRTFTTTAGIGPIVPGAAVQGFSSFAEVLSPGDQFYYCIQSVDRPADREIGRGTLQPDGSIVRDPIDGTLTEFGGGMKTVAVVAAAEWFSRVENSSKGESSSVEDRSQLAALQGQVGDVRLLTEAGREGVFIYRSGNHSVRVSADPHQGLYVASVSDPSGAQGAWVRQFEGAVNPSWFGVSAGTGKGAANITAWNAMCGALRSRATDVSTYYQALERIRFSVGRFEFAGTIELTDGTFVVEGEGVGQPGGFGTILKFPAGVTGIRVHRENTSGASAIRPAGKSANGSVIRRLSLSGGYAGAEGEWHGIHLRASATIEEVAISGFQGNGIHALAAAGAGAGAEGNVNCTRIEKVRVTGCRNGVFLDSADANACTVVSCDFSSNRQWGVWDSSFLGNSYFGVHLSANGWDGAAGSIPTACTYQGNRYYVRVGQEAWCSANPPSGSAADNQGWGYVQPGGSYNGIAAWSAGAVFRCGGAILTDDPNAGNLFSGCYTEGDQNPSQTVAPTLIEGGTHAADVTGTGVHLRNLSGSLMVPGGVGSATRDSSVKTLVVSSGDRHLSFTHNAQAPLGYDLAWNGSNLWFRYANSGNSRLCPFEITGPNTTRQIGPHRVNFVEGLGIIDRTVTIANAAPASGPWMQGAIVFNGAPAAGSPVGWQCVTGGSPGIWRPFYGALSGGEAIGYAAGAGGVVAQAGAKSAPVTLNKTCGQITLHNAPVESGGSVSFVLTNDRIAVGDVLVVSIGSGASADAYDLTVTAVGAGTCRMQLRNRSAGALAESLVLNFAVLKAVAA
ncbi:hypothetical protein [Sphingomonas arenae]|uniref:hypothetical protein n=1 Tax=Sphingomonas arenae TaxID=2812555 RepID=UPI00196878DF|nr:hypothetical protein [Sphingomonas arenae]